MNLDPVAGPVTTGVDELASVQFSFPAAIHFDDGTFLATHNQDQS